MMSKLRHARLVALLHVALVGLFLLSGSVSANVHSHDHDTDVHYPCVFCHLASAPVVIAAAGSDATALVAATESKRYPGFSEDHGPAEEPAHSSHPLRGPPSH
jgi:hypothetical protein